MNPILLLIVILSAIQAIADRAAGSRFDRATALCFALCCGLLTGLSLREFYAAQAYAGVILPILSLTLGGCLAVLLSEAAGMKNHPQAPVRTGIQDCFLLLFPLSLLACCREQQLPGTALFAFAAAFSLLYPVRQSSIPLRGTGKAVSLRSLLLRSASLLPLVCTVCREIASPSPSPYRAALWTGLQCGGLLMAVFCNAIPLLGQKYAGKLPWLLMAIGLGMGLVLPL